MRESAYGVAPHLRDAGARCPSIGANGSIETWLAELSIGFKVNNGAYSCDGEHLINS